MLDAAAVVCGCCACGVHVTVCTCARDVRGLGRVPLYCSCTGVLSCDRAGLDGLRGVVSSRGERGAVHSLVYGVWEVRLHRGCDDTGVRLGVA